jgi:hypothetical protein
MSLGFRPLVVDIEPSTLQLLDLCVKLLRVRQLHLRPEFQFMRHRVPDIDNVPFEDSEAESTI